MSTHATVGYVDRETNNTVSVYVHFDGYLDGVGVELLESYNSYEAAKQLVDGGDMSGLGSYYVDRGEDWEDVQPLIEKEFNVEDAEQYVYIFTDEWKFVRANGEYVPLSIKIIKEQDDEF